MESDTAEDFKENKYIKTTEKEAPFDPANPPKLDPTEQSTLHITQTHHYNQKNDCTKLEKIILC